MIGALAMVACSRNRQWVFDDTRSLSWIAAWEAAPQLTEDRNMPPVPLTGTTLRQARAGDHPRIRAARSVVE
jgi:hypothetical protein